MRIYKTLFILILALTLGCFPESSGNEKIMTGTRGLELEFMPNTPPSEILLGCDVGTCQAQHEMYILLNNHGTFGISAGSGIILFEGFNPSLAGFPKEASLPEMMPRSMTLPQGDEEVIEVSDTMEFNLPADIDSYDFSLLAKACYPYETRAAVDVCVDPNAANTQNDACTSTYVSVSGGQGAPVAVTKVQPETAQGQHIIRIRIENKGSGEVISKAYTGSGEGENSCRDIPLSEKGKITVIQAKLGDKNLDCTDNDIRLYEKEAELLCRTDVVQAGAYNTILQIGLEYGYKQSFSKSFSVKKLQ